MVIATAAGKREGKNEVDEEIGSTVDGETVADQGRWMRKTEVDMRGGRRSQYGSPTAVTRLNLLKQK